MNAHDAVDAPVATAVYDFLGRGEQGMGAHAKRGIGNIGWDVELFAKFFAARDPGKCCAELRCDCRRV